MIKIIILQLKQIGDVLISTSVVRNLREMYPEAKIDFVVYDYAAGILENNPFIDNIIIINEKERKNPLKLYWRFFKMRNEKYDYLIDLIGDVKSAFLTFCINAKKSIISKNNKLRNKIFYNTRLENNNTNVLKYRNFLISAIDGKIPEKYSVDIFLRETEIQKIKQRMIENKVDFSKPIAAIGANSRREFKKWDINYFVVLINYLIEKYDMQIILYNNKEEKEYAELLKSKINNNKNVYTQILIENIRDLAALLKNCDIFIGNEGGPRHIAESVGIPTFAIAYITHNEEDWILNFDNWNKTVRFVQIDDCLGLSKEEFEKLKEYIGRNRELEIQEFKKVNPEFVIEKLDEMIDYLKAMNLFRKDIVWKK